MPDSIPSMLQFEEAYFERVWGGRRLETVLGNPIPPDRPIGEAWLISDHSECESVVCAGPLVGHTLRELIKANASGILGSRPRLTIHGQFPLLLKILDSADYLSVQVHPDDDDAKRLCEPDVGKTEMWHVLFAEPNSELICGMPPSATCKTFADAIAEKSLGNMLTRFPVQPGTSVFVPAGTVHAIGPGILLAEIQQNSNITYRVYDWDRVGTDGKPRELHVARSISVTRFGSRHQGANTPLAYESSDAAITVLAACRYFAAERIHVEGTYVCPRSDTFHILLGINGDIRIIAEGNETALPPAQALLIPGGVRQWRATGKGEFLCYYVPDLARDIVVPLRGAGHGTEAIVRLGGDPSTSDLARAI